MVSTATHHVSKMKSISIFEIFKIGVGPSSSHTLGPWKAALAFVDELDMEPVEHIQVQLYGSLSKTGVGHATDVAVLLGLMGYDPKKIDTQQINSIVEQVKETKQIMVKSKPIVFHFDQDIVFEGISHQLHPNTLKFTAFSKEEAIKKEFFASIGGGFIECPSRQAETNAAVKLPYPINKAQDLLAYTNEQSCSISDIVSLNESSIRSKEQIDAELQELLDTFFACVYEGCITDGTLPGGLNVARRASALCHKLLEGKSFASQAEWLEALKQTPKGFNAVNKWVSCFALAVNEQNAALGRVVTSPTNGAAGVIPAVLMYYYLFCDYQGEDYLKKFLFTAGEIGCLFKKGATISAAVGGCQAEIGVSSAMAAGGLTEVLGGTAEQCLMAAEIAMEHHLGLTCDPVKGLVQIPCIERNAMGAMKAITAANLALEGDPKASKVSLDAAIKTMWDVSLDMNTKYKETAEGGLAINLPVINPSC